MQMGKRPTEDLQCKYTLAMESLALPNSHLGALLLNQGPGPAAPEA